MRTDGDDMTDDEIEELIRRRDAGDVHADALLTAWIDECLGALCATPPSEGGVIDSSAAAVATGSAVGTGDEAAGSGECAQAGERGRDDAERGAAAWAALLRGRKRLLKR